MSNQSRMIRFTLNPAQFGRMTEEAREAGFDLPEYAKLRALGVILNPAVVAPAIAGRAVVTAEIAPERGHIREQILAAMARAQCSKIVPADIPRLASLLKVTRRQVYSSLGSMVGSGRLRHVGNDYHIIKQEEDCNPG